MRYICENTLQTENILAVVTARNSENGLTNPVLTMASLISEPLFSNKILHISGSSPNSWLIPICRAD